MKIFPDSRNMDESPLFARAYYGELIGLVLGILSIIRMGTMNIEYVGVMFYVWAVHAFLIWAWGRRYRFMNWLYALWNVPTFLMLLALSFGIGLSLVTGMNSNASSRGLQLGDASVGIIGLAAVLVALASRGIGLYWCVEGRREIEFPESSPIPAALTALILVLSAGYLFVNTRLLEKVLVGGGMGFYGLGISI